MPVSIRAAALLAALSTCAPPAQAAPRHRPPACAPVFIDGVGPVWICAAPARR